MDTTLARVLAIALIANSHLEAFYPVRQLAADGLIGNALFFLMSGLGLALSARSKGGPERFLPWYRRRLSRIYPALWITAAILILPWAGNQGGTALVRDLIWPTPYGFIAQIVPFYAVYYLFLSGRDPRFHLWGIAALVVPYVVVACFFYNIHALSWIFYGQMMLLGGWWAGRSAEFGVAPRRDWAILGLSLPLYVGLKFAMATGRLPNHVMVLHVLTVPILWSILGLCNQAKVTAWLKSGGLAARGASLVASMTLEIYLVHDFVFQSPRVSGLPFPLNVGVFCVLSLVGAWCLNRAVDRLSDRGKLPGRIFSGPKRDRRLGMGLSEIRAGS